MEKRTPAHSLADFKRVCGDADRIVATATVWQTAALIGFGREEIAEVIRSMQPKHFYKSMTSYADHRRWQDVYHVPSQAGLIYVKFTDSVMTEFILLSFKEK